MLKSSLLFALDLAAIVCALRAASLIFTVNRIYLPSDGARAAWEMSEAAGFMGVGCFCALAALVVAVLVF